MAPRSLYGAPIKHPAFPQIFYWGFKGSASITEGLNYFLSNTRKYSLHGAPVMHLASCDKD